MGDAESWMELCELYIGEQEFAKAAFCCEELILQNPNNHIYFQRYAEIRFTQGGFENMEMAKTYYAKAVTLNSSNMRALYGLLLVRTMQLLALPWVRTLWRHSVSDVVTARLVAEVPGPEEEGASQDCGLVGEANFK